MGVSEEAIRRILNGGLLDDRWYKVNYRLPRRISPLAHFLAEGWSAGAAPNAFFDSSWYLDVYPDVAATGMDPLTHYVEHGESEGRWPSRVFDPLWYATRHGVECGGGAALAHFVKEGAAEGLRPSALFDPHFYVEKNPDLPRDPKPATIHYIQHGYAEVRQVCAEFDIPWYRAHYHVPPHEDVFRHYVRIGRVHGYALHPDGLASPAKEVRRFSAPSSHFEEFDARIATAGPPLAKAIAFYLPQFHAIPENDLWWGTGFTEWRNVCRGQPRFIGHYQPRVPRDLGFYDLSNSEVMRQQIELARAAGIYGFCFYYYQFGSKRLLEGPLNRLLADHSLDIPFCLMWANENWTRRWDGMEAEVLLEQSYSHEDDDFLIESVAKAMADPRYIRAAGRPMFIVYRPGIIPGMRERSERWRAIFRERYGIEPWFLMAQSFQERDPRVYGLDGAVEFPPHKLSTNVHAVTSEVHVLDPQFNGIVYDYADFVATSLNEPYPDYPLIKTVVPSWDNDARRQGSGTTVTNSTPAAYQHWLSTLSTRARQHKFGGDAFVFINAWNEWAEGAYLEPDVHFGSAYLNATARALVGEASGGAAEKAHVLLVGHDAYEHGAQLTLLNIGRTLVESFGCKVTFLLLGPGPLLPAYRAWGDTFVVDAASQDLDRTLDEIANRNVGFALTNTVVAGSIVPHLKRRGMRVVSLVHELPRLIREYNVEHAAQHIAKESDVAVFAAEYVRNAFESAVGSVVNEVVIRPQGRYSDFPIVPDSRADVFRELGLPQTARLVIGIGYGDLRKGIDLFFETARQAAAVDPNLVFLWFGKLESAASVWIAPHDSTGALPENVRLVGFTADVAQYGRYVQAADAFFLSSREDPFPSTVIDALACGLPLVGFADRTGTGTLIERFGQLVPAYDIPAALQALRAQIAAQSDEKRALRATFVAEELDWNDYVFSLLEHLLPSLKRVSVVVPNYNYAHYLETRLASIFQQTLPVYEVIVLDDASTDGSVEAIARIAEKYRRKIRIVANEKNSGAIMRQWAKGARLAQGELLWIAEADDGSAPQFLARLAADFGDETLMAFSDSRQIDSDDIELAPSYNYYLRTQYGSDFDQDFRLPGAGFAERYLSRANSILNVSSALFRRAKLEAVFDARLTELETYRFAGDWLVYLAMCRMGGDVCYLSESLNVHRRHQASATHMTKLEAHVDEVARVHAAFGTLFDVPESLRVRQKTYLDELRVHFGLAKATPAESVDA